MSVSSQSEGKIHTNHIRKSIAKAFNNKQFADVTLYLGELGIPAHSLVLAARSGYFKMALSSSFEEGITKEFKYEEGSLQAYWRVFQYMYTGAYFEEGQLSVDKQDDDELVKDVRVYGLADYFLVEGLKSYALARFKPKVEQLWASENFVDCIRNVYESTSDPECKMKEAVVDVAYQNVKELWKKRPFQDLLREGGDFVTDLMEKLVKNKF